MSNFCSKCGNELKDKDAKICHHCGVRTKESNFPSKIVLGISFIFIILLLFSAYIMVNDDDISLLPLRVTDINESQIEDDIFNIMNEERIEYGISELRRSSLLDEIAKDKSRDMIERDYFAHVDLDGNLIGDTLKQEEIFYFAATENLYYFPLSSRDTDVGAEVVKGWIASPGHRIPILDYDELWEHVGIGVEATETYHYGGKGVTLYITAVFASFETIYDDKLERGLVQYLNIYDKRTGHDFDAEVTIMFQSKEGVDLYIIPDREYYNAFLKRSNIQRDSIVYERNTQYYNDTIDIEPGYGLIIDASNSRNDVEYSLSLIYNQP